MVFLYHERQVAALCGQHCLNNLLQGPYFTEWDLASIAHEFDRQESALLDAETRRTYESANVDAQGNFSIQVLSSALQRKHNIELHDTRKFEHRDAMNRPSGQEGFVLNRDSHWYCLRKLHGEWWQCNSSFPAPEKMLGYDLEKTLKELQSSNWTVFVVKGALPYQPVAKRASSRAAALVFSSHPPSVSILALLPRPPAPPSDCASTTLSLSLSPSLQATCLLR